MVAHRQQGQCGHGTCPNKIRIGGLCGKHYRAATPAGRRGTVPPERVLEHVNKLNALGWTDFAIEEATAVHHGSVRAVRTAKAIYRTTETAILALPLRPATEPSNPVSAVGFTRRVRALGCLGWSQAEIGRVAGLRADRIAVIMRTGTCSRGSHEKMVAAFEELKTRQGPDPHRARISRAKGWDDMAAWDDDTIDDPNAHPNYTGYDEQTVRRLLAGELAESTRAAFEAGEPPQWTAVDLDEAVRRFPTVTSTVIVELTGAKLWMAHAALTANRSKDAPPRVRYIITASPEKVRELYNSGLSLAEVGRLVGGVPKKTVQMFMEDHGIPRRKPGGRYPYGRVLAEAV